MLSIVWAFYGVLRVVGKNRLYQDSRATRPIKRYKTGPQRCSQPNQQLPKTRFKTHAVCIAHAADTKRRNARRCANHRNTARFDISFGSKLSFHHPGAMNVVKLRFCFPLLGECLLRALAEDPISTASDREVNVRSIIEQINRDYVFKS